MSKIIMSKKYDGEEINDIIEALNETEFQEEQGIIQGHLRVTVEYITPDDCECQGFTRDINCKHHVICY